MCHPRESWNIYYFRTLFFISPHITLVYNLQIHSEEITDIKNLINITIMISKKLQDAMNDQISAEMWSSNLYLSMSLYFAKEGYEGFAQWMKIQSLEELEHAHRFADFIIKRDGEATVNKIDTVPTGWGRPIEVFEHALGHETRISNLIDKLLDLAQAENDKAAQHFLWEFVKEQIEEESTVRSIVDKLKIAGDTGLYEIDKFLATRVK